MHVILKPFIKLFIWVLIIFGVAELAGVDVQGLLEGLDLGDLDLGDLDLGNIGDLLGGLVGGGEEESTE